MARDKAAKKLKHAEEREDRIRRALKARIERDPQPTFRELALEFGVARSVLCDRASGNRRNRQIAHEKEQKLSPGDEKALEKWCQDLDDWGFPPRMDLLRGFARALAQIRAEEEGDASIAHLGINWTTRFLSRHPTIAARYSSQLDRQRAYASNPMTLRDYFRKLQKVIRIHKIEEGEKYNMDEKGFILGFSTRSRVICRSYRRNPLVTQDGNREMLTVLECVSADCFILPAFVIYKAKSHLSGWHGETDDLTARFCLSNNGWTDNVLGLRWLIEHFDPNTRARAAGRARLLIVDGHASHISYEFCKYALSNNIRLISLPAHSTHLLQPLDVGLFGPLQHFYGKAADDYMRNTRAGILKGTFWGFYRQAREKAYTKQNIKQAFRATGVSPFNPNAVLTRLPCVKTPPPPLSDDIPEGATEIWRTPKTRRDLRRQTNAAVRFVSQETNRKPGETIAVILRLAHLAEASLARADIEAFQTKLLREEFAGKKAAKTDRRVLSKAQIVTGTDVDRLQKERDEKATKRAERLQKRKEKEKAKDQKAAGELPKKEKKKVQFVEENGNLTEAGESNQAEEDTFLDIDDFLTPQTGRARHPIQSPLLSTMDNPNRRLPDCALTMRLRTRK